MHYRFPGYDDPPAPQEPPQTYTPLSPPRPRHNLPLASPSQLTPQKAPTDSPQTGPTITQHETDSKTKPRTRVLSSSRSPDSKPCFPTRLSGAKANLSPPTTMPCTGTKSVSPGRRRTLSAASVSGRRDSVDVDARSIISSLLDAYCQSDATDQVRDDGASGVSADEIASLANSSFVCRRRGSNSTIVASELPTKRSKPASLLIEASPRWGSSATAPQTAPATKNTRPLPALPAPYNSQRHTIRPLPHLPFQPPPYIPSIGNSGASKTDTQSVPSLSFPRSSAPIFPAPSSGSTSSTAIPAASTSTASIDLSSALDRPMVSKYYSLPLLTIPSSPSSQQPSPLPPYIPVPPSPRTARCQQASKLTRMLGEEISPEFLGPNQVSRLPTPSIVTAQPVSQRQTNKLTNDLSHPPTRQIRSRAVRPNAIYVLDDTSEESNVEDGLKEDSEKNSFFDFNTDDDDEAFIQQGGIKIELSVEESDDTASTDASEILSPSDSVSEEIDDMEEARIGWALQNAITYQKAACVKRTSRMWVLEKNGQRWEEQDHMNVRQALRQL